MEDNYLEVTPQQLSVQLRLGQPEKLRLNLRNLTQHPVAFKVKTTAPSLYMVRPAQGVIPETKEQTCEIVLSALQEYPLKRKHKFLVQSLVVTEDVGDLPHFWKEKESLHKVSKSEYKEEKITIRLHVPGPVLAAGASHRGAQSAAHVQITDGGDTVASSAPPQNSNSLSSLPSAPKSPPADVASSSSAATTSANPEPALASNVQTATSSPTAVSHPPAAVQAPAHSSEEYDELISHTARLEKANKRLTVELKTEQKESSQLRQQIDALAKQCDELRGSLSGMQSQLRQRTSAADAKPNDAGRDHDCGDAVDTKGAAGSSMAMNLILLVLGLLIGYFVARS